MKALITLATLAKATAQEVADQVVHHLLTQAEQSRQPAADNRGLCMYRAVKPDKVLKCAAGSLIGDDEYREDMEGVNWGGLLADGVVPEKHAILIARFQDVHDHYPVGEWPERLEDTCIAFGHTFNPPAGFDPANFPPTCKE